MAKTKRRYQQALMRPIPESVRRALDRITPEPMKLASKQKVTDSRSSRAQCKFCGEEITFNTDGMGHLVAMDWKGHKVHRHPDG